MYLNFPRPSSLNQCIDCNFCRSKEFISSSPVLVIYINHDWMFFTSQWKFRLFTPAWVTVILYSRCLPNISACWNPDNTVNIWNINLSKSFLDVLKTMTTFQCNLHYRELGSSRYVDV